MNFFYTLRIIVSQETYLLTVKELELKDGRATGIPAILKSLEDDEAPLPKFNTDEDRSFFEVVLFIHKIMAGGIAEMLITVLEMAKINKRVKPIRAHFPPSSNNSKYWQQFKFAAEL